MPELLPGHLPPAHCRPGPAAIGPPPKPVRRPTGNGHKAPKVLGLPVGTGDNAPKALGLPVSNGDKTPKAIGLPVDADDARPKPVRVPAGFHGARPNPFGGPAGSGDGGLHTVRHHRAGPEAAPAASRTAAASVDLDGVNLSISNKLLIIIKCHLPCAFKFLPVWHFNQIYLPPLLFSA